MIKNTKFIALVVVTASILMACGYKLAGKDNDKLNKIVVLLPDSSVPAAFIDRLQQDMHYSNISLRQADYKSDDTKSSKTEYHVSMSWLKQNISNLHSTNSYSIILQAKIANMQHMSPITVATKKNIRSASNGHNDIGNVVPLKQLASKTVNLKFINNQDETNIHALSGYIKENNSNATVYKNLSAKLISHLIYFSQQQKQ